MHTVYSTHIVHKFSKVNHALDMAIEAHLPYVLVRSGPNPRSLLLGGGHSFPIKWIDPRSDPWGRWLRIHQQECRIHQQECIDLIESAYHDAWFCFTSIQVNVDMQAAPHVDSNNEMRGPIVLRTQAVPIWASYEHGGTWYGPSGWARAGVNAWLRSGCHRAFWLPLAS